MDAQVTSVGERRDPGLDPQPPNGMNLRSKAPRVRSFGGAKRLLSVSPGLDNK